jgi:hypothetical protein
MMALFNFDAISPETKENIQTIVADIFSWEDAKATVETHTEARADEFKDEPQGLNGKPTADVTISSVADPHKSYSMLVGNSPNGFLILLPTK